MKYYKELLILKGETTMLVRFGFVAMSVILENASPSKTVTYKTYHNLAQRDSEAALAKVRQVSKDNLVNAFRLLHYCNSKNIKLYRFSSKIYPLATHPKLSYWDFINETKPQLIEIGNFIKKNNIRVTFHPDHYTIINSPKEEVFISSVMDLTHHCRILNAMRLDEHSKLLIHVGGGYNNKDKSLKKFIENWSRLPKDITKRISLENDDKIFTANDTLYLCEKLQLPLVLDIHHFRCNHEEGNVLEDIYPRFFSTWNNTGLTPKIHISSPKSETNIRSHHNFVNSDDLYSFLMMAREYKVNLDVMVEAKQKDKAMFILVQDLCKLPGITLINNATIKIQ